MGVFDSFRNESKTRPIDAFRAGHGARPPRSLSRREPPSCHEPSRAGRRSRRSHDRPGEDARADLEVRLRPVHRTSRPVHPRRDVGGDARGPEVLLSRRRRGTRVGHAQGQGGLVGGRRLSVGSAGALAVDDRGRQEGRHDGPRATVHRRAHARHRGEPGRERDPAGAAGPRRGPAVRRPRRARGRGAGRGRARVGLGRVRSTDTRDREPGRRLPRDRARLRRGPLD